MDENSLQERRPNEEGQQNDVNQSTRRFLSEGHTKHAKSAFGKISAKFKAKQGWHVSIGDYSRRATYSRLH